MFLQLKKLRELQKNSLPARGRRIIETELSRLSGNAVNSTKDPSNTLSEHSRHLFDLAGKINAEKMLNPEGESKPESFDRIRKDGEFYIKFSEYAFDKGRLLCAVEQNGGKAVFTSCLRRAAAVCPLRDKNATDIRIPHSHARLSFQSRVDGALSLTIETAQSLTKTLELFEQMATGEIDGGPDLSEVKTAFELYPFLSIDNEKRKLRQYREAIAELPDKGGEDRKYALNYGIDRLNSIISHKDKMKRDFLTELGKIMQNSKEAAEFFSRPSLKDEIIEELTESTDDGTDGGTNGGTDDNPQKGGRN